MAETPENRTQTVMLLDFYSALLSERQLRIMTMYYMDDMSLSEISQELGITRQGVRDAIKKSEAILGQTEQKLKLMERFSKSKEKLGYIIGKLTEISRQGGIDVSDIIAAVKEISENI